MVKAVPEFILKILACQMLFYMAVHKFYYFLHGVFVEGYRTARAYFGVGQI